MSKSTRGPSEYTFVAGDVEGRDRCNDLHDLWARIYALANRLALDANDLITECPRCGHRFG